MKKYVNGYDSPVFEWQNALGDKIRVELSSSYQKLIEYEEDVTTLDRFTDGSKEATIHFYEYSWTLIWSDELELIEKKKIEQVQEALKSFDVTLIPHKDYPWRYCLIVMQPGKRTLELDSHFGGNDDTTNFGYEITFLNKTPIKKPFTADPNYIPVNSCRVGFEY